MLWYVIAALLSAGVYSYGVEIGLTPLLKWIGIGLVWGAAVHFAGRGKEGYYHKKWYKLF